MKIRSYSELRRLDSFEERFKYLALSGSVGRSTFGFDRYLNQRFYTSKQWRDMRHEIIARDLGMDLGCPGYEIYDRIYIHHMNPIAVAAVSTGTDSILNPDFLITTTHNTHNAIHYGNGSRLVKPWSPRKPGDTNSW